MNDCYALKGALVLLCDISCPLYVKRSAYLRSLCGPWSGEHPGSSDTQLGPWLARCHVRPLNDGSQETLGFRSDQGWLRAKCNTRGHTGLWATWRGTWGEILTSLDVKLAETRITKSLQLEIMRVKHVCASWRGPHTPPPSRLRQNRDGSTGTMGPSLHMMWIQNLKIYNRTLK